MYGFGQAPAIPGLPAIPGVTPGMKPEIPGYVTAEACAAASQAEADTGKRNAAIAGAAALIVGVLIGKMVLR